MERLSLLMLFMYNRYSAGPCYALLVTDYQNFSLHRLLITSIRARHAVHDYNAIRLVINGILLCRRFRVNPRVCSWYIQGYSLNVCVVSNHRTESSLESEPSKFMSPRMSHYACSLCRFLASQLHFLANRNAGLAIPPLFWPVNCIKIGGMLHC